jgi:hypothetical protein
MSTTAPTNYSWRFFRAGGVEQVQLRNGNDLLQLPLLNQKLWVALACPTRGLEFDTKTLDLLDTDKDGRIRVPEVLQAIGWLREVLVNLDPLVPGTDILPLTAFNGKTEAGGSVLAGAKRVLQNLGKLDTTSISLADVADTSKIFAATKFNGDGVVPANSAEDAATQAAIADIMTTHGSVPDRSGQPGVDQAKVDAFFAEASALSAWRAQGESDKTILPIGEATANASAAVKAAKVKIGDYFARCRLAEFDPRAAMPLNRAETEFAALAAKDLTAQAEDIAKLPLARIEAGRALPLTQGLNPAWTAVIARLRADAITSLLGPNRVVLIEPEWLELQAKLAPFDAWMAVKPVTAVEKLPPARIRELVSSAAKVRINQLLQKDAALAGENAQIGTVEKVLLFCRDLYRFLNNFVNFSEFYARKGAIFQAGTLYLDGRSCNLCLPVADAGKHAALATHAATYLAYCDCTRPGGEKLSIVAGFTNGDSDRLMVGRNGVFYDRKGRDWDATISKIVANPISLREAFWAPYKKFVRMIEEQVAKRAAAAEAESQNKLTSAATALATADKTQPTDKAPASKKIDVGTVAAIGVAIGGVGAMITGVLSAFFGLGAWMPIGIIALFVLISGPSLLLAFLKLRQRNLGPILDANGWAINGRARINVPFGAALTDVASLPPGCERSLDDPFADKKRPWGFYLTIIVLLLLALSWYLGKLDDYLPGSLKSTTQLGTNAPAYKPAKAEAAAAAPKK